MYNSVKKYVSTQTSLIAYETTVINGIQVFTIVGDDLSEADFVTATDGAEKAHEGVFMKKPDVKVKVKK